VHLIVADVSRCSTLWQKHYGIASLSAEPASKRHEVVAIYERWKAEVRIAEP